MGSQVTTTSGSAGLPRRRKTLLTAAGALTAALLALTACSTGAPAGGTHSSGVSDNGTVPAGPSG